MKASFITATWGTDLLSVLATRILKEHRQASQILDGKSNGRLPHEFLHCLTSPNGAAHLKLFDS